MNVIVLAGGLGTRLGNITNDTPKPMLPISDRPFLEYLLDYLIRSGADTICLAIGYRSQNIHDHFGEKYKGVSIVYSIEDAPLGTGGALRQAFEHVDTDDVLVLNGDTFFNIDIPSMWDEYLKSNTRIMLAVKQLQDCSRYGTIMVNEEGVVTGFKEKKQGGKGLINGGVYALNKNIFNDYKMEKRFSFESFLMDNVSELRPLSFSSTGYFIDIGIPEDYERAQTEIPNMVE